LASEPIIEEIWPASNSETTLNSALMPAISATPYDYGPKKLAMISLSNVKSLD